jgi:hypothetical protein
MILDFMNFVEFIDYPSEDFELRGNLIKFDLYWIVVLGIYPIVLIPLIFLYFEFSL